MKYEGCTILVHLYIIIGLNNSHGSYSGFYHLEQIKLRLLHCMLGVWRAVYLQNKYYTLTRTPDMEKTYAMQINILVLLITMIPRR